MELIFASEEVEEQCRNIEVARKKFGGDLKLAVKLQARINMLEMATCLKDIAVQPQLHFHSLSNKKGARLKGCFAIDVANRKCPWRLILQPLNDDGDRFDPCNVDEISTKVAIVEIMEVSRHYD